MGDATVRLGTGQKIRTGSRTGTRLHEPPPSPNCIRSESHFESNTAGAYDTIRVYVPYCGVGRYAPGVTKKPKRDVQQIDTKKHETKRDVQGTSDDTEDEHLGKMRYQTRRDDAMPAPDHPSRAAGNATTPHSTLPNTASRSPHGGCWAGGRPPMRRETGRAGGPVVPNSGAMEWDGLVWDGMAPGQHNTTQRSAAQRSAPGGGSTEQSPREAGEASDRTHPAGGEGEQTSTLFAGRTPVLPRTKGGRGGSSAAQRNGREGNGGGINDSKETQRPTRCNHRTKAEAQKAMCFRHKGRCGHQKRCSIRGREAVRCGTIEQGKTE
ncbi:unnamed protein product [Pseudo-nitzschia multistriata]|uniref:Uncharacterized protein n=1 Tax=Pseudo-nitzschia multistriata TaxID=183589 RepID=A0A448ZC54_9STRA|nr:unnamed protein product [Pseudo-nitzschia multistriata]